jgi:hypothetical protein
VISVSYDPVRGAGGQVKVSGTCENEALELKSFVFNLFSSIEHHIKSGQFQRNTTGERPQSNLE